MSMREIVIRLEAQPRRDRRLYVSSPDLPLLHMTIAGEDELEVAVFPVVRRMLEDKYKKVVELRRVDALEALEEETAELAFNVPAHVIAHLADRRFEPAA